MCVVFIQQKAAYEMRMSDWSSDVCSSDLNMSGIWACSARDGRTKSIVAAVAVCAEIVRSSARLAGTRTVIHAPAIHVGRQRPHVLDALCADGQKVVRQ